MYADFSHLVPLFSGDPFLKSIGLYLQRGFQKGVPSLFQSVKHLYAVPEKVQTIESLLTQYVENFQQHGTFQSSSSGSADAEEMEPASTILWLHYYLAQHYDYLGNSAKAFAFIDQAIRDTPTLVELYMFKAKIFKVMSARSRSFEFLFDLKARR